MTGIQLIVTTVLLLGSTSMAAAECGWGLWTKTVRGRGPITWEVQNGYAEQPACTERREAVLKARAASWSSQLGDQQVKLVEEDNMLRLFFANDVWAIYYVCLPDTVDPRNKREP